MNSNNNTKVMLLLRRPVKAEGDVALFWKASRKREWALEIRSRRERTSNLSLFQDVLTQLELERVGKPSLIHGLTLIRVEYKYWSQSGTTMAWSRQLPVAVKTIINHPAINDSIVRASFFPYLSSYSESKIDDGNHST